MTQLPTKQDLARAAIHPGMIVTLLGVGFVGVCSYLLVVCGKSMASMLVAANELPALVYPTSHVYLIALAGGIFLGWLLVRSYKLYARRAMSLGDLAAYAFMSAGLICVVIGCLDNYITLLDSAEKALVNLARVSQVP